MKLFVLPYKGASEGAKALAEALEAKRIKREGSRYRPFASHVIINWGSSVKARDVEPARIVNPGDRVDVARNKLLTFQALDGAEYLPPYTTDIEVARQWADDGKAVCIRQSLTGNSGAGLSIVDKSEDLVDAPLYTQYIKKRDEFRVHVAFNRVIDYQRKARRLDGEEHNPRIRNWDNGYVFIRDGVNTPPAVLEAATQAVAGLGLDFGGVDVIWNERAQKAYVLEVNTAPGLEGQTVESYANVFKEYVDAM